MESLGVSGESVEVREVDRLSAEMAGDDECSRTFSQKPLSRRAKTTVNPGQAQLYGCCQVAMVGFGASRKFGGSGWKGASGEAMRIRNCFLAGWATDNAIVKQRVTWR